MVRRAFKYVPMLVTEMDGKRLDRIHQRLQYYEEVTDQMEMEIAGYLSKASKSELSTNASVRVRDMINIANYLERIGDIYMEVSRNLGKRKKQKAYFTQQMRDRILNLSQMVAAALDQMVETLTHWIKEIDFERTENLEKRNR
ncbi:MAG: PhoU domain-containing protein [Owenweeksia sp.]|nr:PhoU domain-containing protein [Owenweeksia sp.]